MLESSLVAESAIHDGVDGPIICNGQSQSQECTVNLFLTVGVT